MAPKPDKHALVDFYWSGGVAGYTTHLVIERDGSGQLTKRMNDEPVKFTLPSAALADLCGVLDAADFDHLDENYRSRGIADDFTFRVTHEGRTVTAAGSGQMPRELSKVIEALRAIWAGIALPKAK